MDGKEVAREMEEDGWVACEFEWWCDERESDRWSYRRRGVPVPVPVPMPTLELGLQA